MKTCTTCQTQTPDSYKLCPQCGTDSLVSTSSGINTSHTSPQKTSHQGANSARTQKSSTQQKPIPRPTTSAKTQQPKSSSQSISAPQPTSPTPKVNRAKRIPMLKPWAVMVLVFICLLGVLMTFKASDGVANWMVNQTSVEEEESMTRQEIAAMGILDYAYDSHTNDAMLVSQIGQNLVSHLSPTTPYDYEFYLIKSNDVNAFAMPSGKIFIFDGLYRQLTEEQIAGVLAHEIIHAQNRHGIKGMYKTMSLAAVLSWVFGVNDIGTEVIHELSTLNYSRELETEADVEGVKLMIEAGYQPDGMVTMLMNLDGMAGHIEEMPEWMLDHPLGKNRAERVSEEIESVQ